MHVQGTKKLASDSPGLVDFAVGLVDFTLNLPKGQVKALREIFFEEIRASWKIELLCTLMFNVQTFVYLTVEAQQGCGTLQDNYP